jgi:hypothetical protein
LEYGKRLEYVTNKQHGVCKKMEYGVCKNSTEYVKRLEYKQTARYVKRFVKRLEYVKNE